VKILANSRGSADNGHVCHVLAIRWASHTKPRSTGYKVGGLGGMLRNCLGEQGEYVEVDAMGH